MLERTPTLARLLEGHDDAFIVTGLGNAANDVAAITSEHPRAFTMDGAMGAAVSLGLGVALASPAQEVIVVTGDGELLMNGTSLATVALQRPGNLKIIVLDNGQYGLTGEQTTATHTVADIEVIANGCGLHRTLTVRSEEGIEEARQLLRGEADTTLVVVKVAPGLGASIVIERDGTRLRDRFRDHVLQVKGRAT